MAEIELQTTVNMTIPKNIVTITLTIESVRHTMVEAFNDTTAFVKTYVERLRKLDIAQDCIKATSVYTSPKYEYTNVETFNYETPDNGVPTPTSKTKTSTRKKVGYESYAYVYVTLPVTWADETHKFSSIFTIANAIVNKKSLNYSFGVDESIDYKSELRRTLIRKSKEQLMELLSDIATSNPPQLIRANYGASASLRDSHMIYRSASSTPNKTDEQPEFDLDVIDTVISEEFVPTTTISDSIITVWEI